MIIDPAWIQYAKSALPSAAIGLGAMGTAGWVGAHGNPRGIPAGMMGTPGGGMRGAFSGAVLGAIGVGGLWAAGRLPGLAKPIGSFLASIATSAPVQRAAARIGGLPGPGAEARQVLPQLLQGLMTRGSAPAAATTPHQIAAHHLEQLLLKKQALHIAKAAGVGAFGGAMVGLPLGGLTGAYRAGERTVGPMGAG